MSNYLPTIGIEVHVELNTRQKAFSKTLNIFGREANTLINPIDLGLPGVLPNLNREIIDYGIKTALALNCEINRVMYFDRKNYFYADNPKNFQITQAKTPLGYNGYLEIEIDKNKQRIAIERMHLEEDTAKSVHDTDKTYLDFNRAGVPLIEIVTKPVIKNSVEAIKYLEKLRETLLYLGISDVKMEEGSMRCDVNISLSQDDTLGTKVEVKNIGSIKSAGLAIEHEIKRQREMLEAGKTITEETRRFDENNKTTIVMRQKETGNDYRYFPEPDIPIIEITDEEIEKLKSELPKLPDEMRKELKELGVNDNNIEALIRDPEMLAYYDSIKNDINNHVIAINILISDLKAYQNKLSKPIADLLSKQDLICVVTLLEQQKASKQQVKEILAKIIEEEIEWLDAVTTINQEIIDLEPIILNIIASNPESVADYKEGKDRAIKHLMGQIMKETKGAADAKSARDMLILILDQQ